MGKGSLFTFAWMLVSATTVAAGQGMPTSGTNLGKVTGGDIKGAHVIIEKKCTSCHSTSVINNAVAAGKDLLAIQIRMEQKGAKLTKNDREVLGIYWKQHPLKVKK